MSSGDEWSSSNRKNSPLSPFLHRSGHALAAETPGNLHPKEDADGLPHCPHYTKQQASLPWGHQEVPARFNFASDVMDYWAGMEKVMGGEETQRWTIGLFTNSSIHSTHSEHITCQVL